MKNFYSTSYKIYFCNFLKISRLKLNMRTNTKLYFFYKKISKIITYVEIKNELNS